MIITLSAEHISIANNISKLEVLIREQSSKDSMWYLDLLQSPRASTSKVEPKTNSICKLNKKKDIIKYLSTVIWNPIPEIWIQAINVDFFVTWLELNSKLVRNFLSRSRNIETGKGYLKAIRKNISSTKPTELQEDEIKGSNRKTNEIYVKTLNL